MSFPEQIRYQSAGGPVVFSRQDGFHARHDLDPGHQPIEHELVRLEPTVAVMQGAPGQDPDSDGKTMPVYRLDPAGPVATPTGLVSVRLAEGVQLEDRRQELASLGFEVESVSGPLPHVGWVRAASGRPEDALEKFPELMDLEAVEAVEPQMLMPRAQRAANRGMPGRY